MSIRLDSVTVALADLLASATLVAVTVTFVVVIWDGAVYRPVLSIDPASVGLMDQRTAVLSAPVTLAVNFWVWPLFNDAVVGGMVTAKAAAGCRVMVAVRLWPGSATLMAVTVTVCRAVSVDGAV